VTPVEKDEHDFTCEKSMLANPHIIILSFPPYKKDLSDRINIGAKPKILTETYETLLHPKRIGM